MKDVPIYLSAIQLIIVVIATLYAVKQLKEYKRVRQVEVMDKIFEYVSAPDARAARNMARNLRLPENFNDLNDNEKEAIEFTLIRWARVGVLLEQKVFSSKDEDALFRGYSLSIVNSWERLKTYVEFIRKQSGMPDYYYHVELLAHSAIEWRKKHNLPEWK